MPKLWQAMPTCSARMPLGLMLKPDKVTQQHPLYMHSLPRSTAGQTRCWPGCRPIHTVFNRIGGPSRANLCSNTLQGIHSHKGQLLQHSSTGYLHSSLCSLPHSKQLALTDNDM
jgi:hypothetical protein